MCISNHNCSFNEWKFKELPSTELNFCTHLPIHSNNETIVKMCKTTPDNEHCVLKEECNLNFDEDPVTTPGKCTH